MSNKTLNKMNIINIQAFEFPFDDSFTSVRVFSGKKLLDISKNC